ASGKLNAGANLTLIARKPRTIYSSEVGQQLAWGAAGAYKINDRVSAIAELFGRVGVGDVDLSSNPLEAGGAVRVRATHAFSVLAGGGGGLVRGIGSPGMRVFASVGWAADTSDDDNDGIPNHQDTCPLVPED